MALEIENSHMKDVFLYTPAKQMFSGVYWNVSVCPSPCLSVCPSVYKMLVSIKVLAGVLVTFSHSSSFLSKQGTIIFLNFDIAKDITALKIEGDFA